VRSITRDITGDEPAPVVYEQFVTSAGLNFITSDGDNFSVRDAA